MTEIYEFGLSLNNSDGGLPHLQAYKLLYAWWLADCGYLNEARRLMFLNSIYFDFQNILIILISLDIANRLQIL